MILTLSFFLPSNLVELKCINCSSQRSPFCSPLGDPDTGAQLVDGLLPGHFFRSSEASMLLPPGSAWPRTDQGGRAKLVMSAHFWPLSMGKPGLTQTSPGCPAGWAFPHQPSLLPLLCPQGLPPPPLIPHLFPPINFCS